MARAGDNVLRLSGEVTKILFQNKENGYTVCVLEDEHANEYTLTGILPGLCAGEALTVRAVKVTHPVYGDQWRVETFEKELPKDEGAILRYLSGRALRGIGPKRAKAIVERFGADTLSVLENSPEMLTAIPGISPKTAKSVGEQFRAQFGLRQVMLFFGGTFGMKTALNIYQALGAGAIEQVKKNPYLLCGAVRGIGFRRADELAASLGYAPASPARLSAGLSFLLSEAYYREGHVYLPREELFSRAEELLGVSRALFAPALYDLCRRGAAVAEEERVYPGHAWAMEREAAERLITLSRTCLLHRVPNVEKVIEKTEKAEGITYSEEQKLAIRTASEHPFSIITGGPGTGKTTLTRALMHLFSSLGMEVCLAAPTGRAAKRLGEKAHAEARTLHRVLEMAYSGEDDPTCPRFARDEKNPLTQSVFLIDEVSMVDLELLVSFLRAVKPGSRVILIGDADQLPSVGAGNVLRDLIFSARFPVTTLSVIYRQGETSAILSWAHAVRRGQVTRLKENAGDLFYLARPDAEATAETVASLLSVRLPRTYGEEAREFTQVLVPARRGAAGTVRLNALLQSVLNPPEFSRRETVFGEVTFREGDRVMQIKNDYDLEVKTVGEDGKEVLSQGVFNGDIGKITEIDPVRERVTVSFEGRSFVTYPFSALEELEHAWAITVHKSQGSEYDTVVLALFGTPPPLRRRALLYTAITRAKKRLIVVGSGALAREMTENAVPETRYSTLGRLLQEAQG